MKKRMAVTDFAALKSQKQKITVMTAYDYTSALLVDEAGIDVILVGDSLGMVILGYEDTLQVTMGDMLHHTRAASRGAGKAMVIADMPFLSYHISPEEAVRNAGRFIQEAGAQAVKLEGGKAIAPQIEAIIRAQIPVLGHLGLTPQSVHRFGGFKVQGKDAAAAQELIEEALLLQELGVFGIVLECIPAALAQAITSKLRIPTIGIGAGAGCDGQVLVFQDVLGLNRGFTPKFVKRYGELGDAIVNSLKGYAEEVRSGAFPEAIHTFSMDDEVLKKLY